MTKPVTQPKRVAARGRGVSHLMTYPQAHKFTWVLIPLPEVPLATPPVAGLSWITQPLLFEEPALSCGEEVGPSVATPSGVSMGFFSAI